MIRNSKPSWWMPLGLAAVGLLFTYKAEAALRYIPQATANGARYLIVEGSFEFSDNLDMFLEAVRSHNPVGVGFNSRGGNVAKAIEMGRLIRSLKLATIQVRGPECASACALAFLGGVWRFAEPGSIGVHKSSFSDTNSIGVDDAVSAVQHLTADVIAYMLEMGVDPALLQLSLRYDSDDIRYLSGSEMAQYRVTTEESLRRNEGRVGPSQLPSPSTQTEVATGQPDQVGKAAPSLDIPVARSGIVQHPKQIAPLKASAAEDARKLREISNGAAVEILENINQWYLVRVNGYVGYMHHTWVWVQQFEEVQFGRRFIQVKSLKNLTDAESYVRSSQLPLAAHLTSNRWFAITLRDTYRDAQVAKSAMQMHKEKGAIPSDSFMTYGNSYVRKVCCD